MCLSLYVSVSVSVSVSVFDTIRHQQLESAPAVIVPAWKVKQAHQIAEMDREAEASAVSYPLLCPALPSVLVLEMLTRMQIAIVQLESAPDVLVPAWKVKQVQQISDMNKEAELAAQEPVDDDSEVGFLLL